MKRTSLILLLIMSSSLSLCQTKFAIGITGSANIGLGDFGDTYAIGYGGTTTLFFTAVPVTDLTLSIGYNKWDKDNLGFSTIPLLAGFRYYYDAKVVNLYIPAYLGLHFVTREAMLPTAEVNGNIIGGNEISKSNTYFGFGIGLGVLTPLSSTLALDISINFNSISASESNLIYISVHGGIQFGL